MLKLNLDMEHAMDVVAMGRASVDFVPDVYGSATQCHQYTKFLGGSPANTAVAMAQQGIKVGFIGKVGHDILGDYLRYYMKQKGIDTSHLAICQDESIRTGFSVAELTAPNHKRSNLYRCNVSDLYLSMEEMDEDYIAKSKIFLFSGTSLSTSPAREAVFLAVEYARKHGVCVAFDPDYRAQSWENPKAASLYYWLAMQKSDILITTREEMSVLEGLVHFNQNDDRASAEFCFSYGVRLVVIKRGEEGSVAYTADGEECRQGIFPSRVISVQGAGDSYSGTFLSRIVRGDSLEKAMKYAAAASALTVSGRSCSEHMPTLALTEQFIVACQADGGKNWVFWE